jgi:hypothetical protein
MWCMSVSPRKSSPAPCLHVVSTNLIHLIKSVYVPKSRPREAPMTPGVWGSQHSQTISTLIWYGCQPYSTATFTPRKSLVLISVRSWVNPQQTGISSVHCTACCHTKRPRWSSDASCLIQYCPCTTCNPQWRQNIVYFIKFKIWESIQLKRFSCALDCGGGGWSTLTTQQKPFPIHRMYKEWTVFSQCAPKIFKTVCI